MDLSWLDVWIWPIILIGTPIMLIFLGIFI